MMESSERAVDHAHVLPGLEIGGGLERDDVFGVCPRAEVFDQVRGDDGGPVAETHQAADADGGVDGGPVVFVGVEAHEQVAGEHGLDAFAPAAGVADLAAGAREEGLEALAFEVVRGGGFPGRFGVDEVPVAVGHGVSGVAGRGGLWCAEYNILRRVVRASTRVGAVGPRPCTGQCSKGIAMYCVFPIGIIHLAAGAAPGYFPDRENDVRFPGYD